VTGSGTTLPLPTLRLSSPKWLLPSKFSLQFCLGNLMEAFHRKT
jgi:hypothetical protein